MQTGIDHRGIHRRGERGTFLHQRQQLPAAAIIHAVDDLGDEVIAAGCQPVWCKSASIIQTTCNRPWIEDLMASEMISVIPSDQIHHPVFDTVV